MRQRLEAEIGESKRGQKAKAKADERWAHWTCRELEKHEIQAQVAGEGGGEELKGRLEARAEFRAPLRRLQAKDTRTTPEMRAVVKLAVEKRQDRSVQRTSQS